MKLRGLVVSALLAGATLLAGAQTPPQGTDTKILTTWTQPPGYVPCSSTVTSGCITGYTEKLTDPTGAITTVPTCSATVTTNCIGPVATYTWGPGGNLYCGTWKITLATNYLDGNGAAGISSPPAAVSVVEPCPFVAPASPGNVAGSPKP